MRKFAAWVKNWLRQWWKWITTGETTLSVGERILSAFGVSVVSGWITGLLAWIFKNPWYGVWIFLGTFLLAEALQAFRAYRLSQAGAEAVPEEAAAQHSASSESESAELQRLRGEVQSQKAVIEGQQQQLSEWEGDRRRFGEFLTDAWVEGTNLRGSKPSKEEARKWEGRVRYLLEQAVGKEVADKVLRHDPHFQSADFDASDAQKFLEMRLHRVDDLRKNVSKRGAIPFRSGFDPYDWNDWKSPPESSVESEAVIDLGDTARLFLMDGSRFVPDDDSERRTIFVPALLEHWVGPMSSAVEAGRTFVATETEFDNCDIYGPGVFLLAEGSVEDTFHKCDWEEEWKAFWPATKPSRYVGAIALKNCKFRRCNFKGVAFVVKPDEYRRLYRRFTGDDLNGR